MRLKLMIMCYILWALSAGPSVHAEEVRSPDIGAAKSHWTFMGGYGISHKGLGATNTTVETADLIVRYGRFLTGELGESWYRGRHEIFVEVPLRTVIRPETAIITGVNLMATWTFTNRRELMPYIFAGGGPVYTNLDIPGIGSELNFSYQGGIGGYYFIRKDMALNINYRLHHISNAGTAEPNEPLNSSRILMGLTVFSLP